MWLNHKTDLQTYFTVNVGLHFVQHQPTLFSPTYEMVASGKPEQIADTNVTRTVFRGQTVFSQ
ncbi:TPA: hypothetical protein ACSP21_001467 [Aeromonas veronii]|uniref:hypothetical protein n=1 Tax=Aeromonas sp. 602200 TaxID=2712040 RepID=UPI0038ECDCAC